MDTLWATTSCSSRAIRPRSTATAACACSSRCSASSRLARSSAVFLCRPLRTVRPAAHAATSQTVDGMMLPESWPCSRAATKTGADAASSSGGAHSARRPSARLPAEYPVSVSATNGWNAAWCGAAA